MKMSQPNNNLNLNKIFVFVVITVVSIFSTNRQALAKCTGTSIPLNIIARNANGVLQPDINFTVYQQKTNPDGGLYFGPSIASGKTDAGGQSNEICANVSNAPYAVKLYESNPTYGFHTIWDSEMSGTGDSIFRTVDYRMSSMNVIMRDADGQVLKHSKFDIYVQSFDINNQPIVDETKLDQDKLLLANANTSEYGARNVFLSAGYYVIRVYASGNKDFFYIWNQKVDTGTITTLDYKLSTLRNVLEDGYGGVIKDQRLSIYHQSFDVRNNPILGALVIADLTTGPTGAVDAYIPPDAYAIKINGTYANAFYYKWKVSVNSQELTTSTYRLSGFRIIIRDASGGLIRNAKFSIGTQRFDALGKPTLNTLILQNISTGELGFADVYLPPDTYIMVYGDKKLFQLDANENQFTKIDWPRIVSLRPKAEVELSNPLGNVNLTLRSRSLPRVRLVNYKTTISGAYKVSAQSVTKPYTIIFYYTSDQLAKKNTKADKMRIAFYNDSTKKWQYVGKNNPTRNRISASVKSTGTFVLVAIK